MERSGKAERPTSNIQHPTLSPRRARRLDRLEAVLRGNIQIKRRRGCLILPNESGFAWNHGGKANTNDGNRNVRKWIFVAGVAVAVSLRGLQKTPGFGKMPRRFPTPDPRPPPHPPAPP